MNEKSPDELFAQLDAVDIDAYTKRTMEQAHSIELFLNNATHESEVDAMKATLEAEDRIAEMDAECPYIGEQVLVTGVMKQAYYNEMKGGFETEDITVTKAPVISFGYTILEFGTDIEGEDIKKVGHQFLVEEMAPRKDASALVDYVPRLFAFAPVGQVSVEHALNDIDTTSLLRNKVPDILDDINERIINASDVCAALLSLADHQIKQEQDIPDDVLQGLVDYATRTLNLEKILPYKARFAGVAYDIENESLAFLHYDEPKKNDAVIIRPSTLSLRPYPHIVNGETVFTDELCWCLDLIIIGREVGDDIIVASVPIANIRSIQPARTSLYR